MSETNLKTASVLAFERKLDPSDALFFAGTWNHRADAEAWRPVAIREKSVRGTISNRLKTKDQDPAKLDAAIENPNLQTVDVAALPGDADTLRARFTLRVLGGTGKPSACNDAGYQQRLQETVEAYAQSLGFGELARRYAFNLANGRFLWRNRIGAEKVEVHVAHLVNGKADTRWVFDGLSLPLRSFDATGAAATALGELAALIEAGLHGSRHVLLEVTAYARVGAGQEVFPSQELILDRGRGDKSKTLYSVDDIAGIHSQKLGNAIRTIDDWYPEAGELGPIAVEPYGSVTTQGKAYRQPKAKADFYNLLDNWVLKGKVPDEGDQHFVMAVLVRGGVFGDAS
ncbi:MAG: type I-F CRISPR-associated protein Csy3 [Pseudomonas sp.]|jgi:CRISPR-associated protein Csy3|nr:type I-F CRISPR-associated protein Csy3 [Xanthomonadaceae bacterium]MDE2037038.1 type I-F CRISPR-associated protein Csy3 [Pseudomonas sp.]MDE2248273.1 type I-F CRISPR-associated protein Csy3 [Xanthomonadaceae bacterium]MDE3211262.1 type I-F CRISPR-associated protein Csy3 [Pseudomonadota bacterium]